MMRRLIPTLVLLLFVGAQVFQTVHALGERHDKVPCGTDASHFCAAPPATDCAACALAAAPKTSPETPTSRPARIAVAVRPVTDPVFVAEPALQLAADPRAPPRDA